MKKTYLLLLIYMILMNGVQAKKPALKFNVVFIGNSITYGAGLKNPALESVPAQTVKYLNLHGCEVKFANCGVSGSTTFDWLPVANGLFKKAVWAADSFYRKGVPLIFSVKLGTNDSAIKGTKGAPVSAEQYRANLQNLIDALLKRYPKCHIVLNCPIWYSPNTHNGATYLAEGLARLQTYKPQIEKLAAHNNPCVVLGDTKAFDFFRMNYLQYLAPEKGYDGTFYLHPNVAGAQKLGEFWAVSIRKYASQWCK